jgi:monoamine oxidase
MTQQDFAGTLREPVGNIHWAGTETASVWIGAGARVAQES